MDDRTKQAFAFAKDSTIQLIALATGVMAFTITFSQDLIDDSVPQPVWIIKVAWGFYFLSTVGGVWALLAMTGTLGRKQQQVDHQDVYAPNSRFPSMLQVGAFLLGSLFTLIFAFVAI